MVVQQFTLLHGGVRPEGIHPLGSFSLDGMKDHADVHPADVHPADIYPSEFPSDREKSELFLSKLEYFLSLQNTVTNPQRIGEGGQPAHINEKRSGAETRVVSEKRIGLQGASEIGNEQSLSSNLGRGIEKDADTPGRLRKEISPLQSERSAFRLRSEEAVRSGTADQAGGVAGRRALDSFERLAFEFPARSEKLKRALSLRIKTPVSPVDDPADVKKTGGFLDRVSLKSSPRSSSMGAPDLSHRKDALVTPDTAHSSNAVGSSRSSILSRLSHPAHPSHSSKSQDSSGEPGRAVHKTQGVDKKIDGADLKRDARNGIRGIARGGDTGVQQMEPDGVSPKNHRSEFFDAKGEQGRTNAHPERGGGLGELSLAAFKYECTTLRAASMPDYQIPRNTDEFINEIVRHFTFVARKGGGEAHIALQPDSLGNMRLNLKLNNNEVSTFIVVDNPVVKDLMLSKLTVLEQSLLQHGLSLGSFQVEVKDSGRRFQAEGQDQDGKRGTGAAFEGGHKEEAVENVVLANAGLPWMSTVINIMV